METGSIITIIMTPLFGALIGYFTNWLAIKMLFRPYTKWCLNWQELNIKFDIPFTPGLFPKEQARLASKVAQTVTHQLLTPDDIRNITVKLITPDNIDLAVDKIVDSILKEFQNIRKLKDISVEIAQLISAFLKQSAPGIIEDATRKSPLVREFLDKAFDNIILNLRIPEKTAQSIADSFFDHIATPNTIRNWLLNILSEENILKLNKLVQEHSKGGYYIISRVVTVKSILENIKEYLKTDPETANETIEEVIKKVNLKDKIALSLVNLDLHNLPYSTVALLRKYFVDLLTQYLIDNSKQLGDKFSTEDMTQILTDRIIRFDASAVNSQTLDTIKREIASFIGKYLEREVGNLIEQAIPALGLDHVVFEKVVKFSPKRLEEIIMDLSRKELSGIQIIGGIIGFAIGCLSAVMNLLV